MMEEIADEPSVLRTQQCALPTPLVSNELHNCLLSDFTAVVQVASPGPSVAHSLLSQQHLSTSIYPDKSMVPCRNNRADSTDNNWNIQRPCSGKYMVCFSIIALCIVTQILVVATSSEGSTAFTETAKSVETRSATVIPHGGLDHCLDMSAHLNSETQQFLSLDALLSRHRQVFLTMPAKAAGSSIKRFAGRCTGQPVKSNFIDNGDFRREFLAHAATLPSIIASHVKLDEPLIHLARHSNPDMLVIYIHREEHERVRSAAEHVLSYRVCQFNNPFTRQDTTMKQFAMERNKTHCILNEDPVIQLIMTRPEEIMWGATRTLTCNTYNAIQENDPNFIIVNYKQSDQLQQLLAKHHCPELLREMLDNGGGIQINTASDKAMEAFIRMPDGKILSVQDWWRNKGPLLEWALDFRKDATCQGKTKHMEDVLFACPQEALQITSALANQW